PVIEIKGNAFWNSDTAERFYIKGLDYQPRSTNASQSFYDHLADKSTCERDIEYFKDLGINTIRVYSIDNSLDHDYCMNLLDEAGIYLILDINTPEASIHREGPECSYNMFYLQSIFSTVDVMAKYDNLIGFFAGNEVINDPSNTNSAKYVKAIVRDLKNYISSQNYRKIPVGFSAADVVSLREQMKDYFYCGDDDAAKIDFWGHNVYSWCGESDMEASGFNDLLDLFENYPIPNFFSEFGCNTISPRIFQEVQAIFSSQMSSVFSGGLAYEYSQEDNNYGLVKITDGKVSTLPDYDYLKSEFESINLPSGDGDYSNSKSSISCPTVQAGIWDSDNDLPTLDDIDIFFSNGAGKHLGANAGDTRFKCSSNFDYNKFSSSSSSSSSSKTTLLSVRQSKTSQSQTKTITSSLSSSTSSTT
ncbi:glycoside hydrolase family 72 protein, partial [Ascoidea rubescens DSM 1968]